MIHNTQFRAKNLDAEFEARTAAFAPGALANAEVPSQPAQPDPRKLKLHWQESLTFADNESIASILLKMERVPSHEIAIVAPPGLRVFRNPVSMRLLQRKAEDLGLEVTVISQDDMTRQLCSEAGFGCYPDVSGVRRENATPRRFEQPLPAGRLGWVSAAAGLCLLALIVFVGWFILPAASISVAPAAAQLALDVPVVADSSISSVDLAAGKIPAHVVTSGDVEGSASITASGQRDLPNQPARGFVTFTNLTGQPVKVPKNTVLLAGPIAFFTAADTDVSPSVKIGDTAIPGAGSASVQASDPGIGGNVPVGAMTAVQGDLASKVSVINHSALSGGSNKKGAYLSADDQAKAKQALLNQLRQQAMDKIRGQIARNETFLPSPSSAGDGAVEELTYAESPEQVTGQTELHMKVIVRGLTFQGDDVNQVVTQAMADAARKRAPGARLSDAPLAMDPPVVLANDGSAIHLQVHSAGHAASPLDGRALADEVRGMAPAAARARLMQTPGVGQADVQLWPAWARTVPTFAWRIQTTTTDLPA